VSRRRIATLLIALLSIGAALSTGMHAQAQVTTERVMVTPGGGTAQTRFVFTGAGFTPGRTVSVRFLLPDGSERRVTEGPAEVVWLVLPDGSFSVDLVPAQRFPAAPPGRWRALFCGFNAATCQLIEFDVLP
jgi:hypothetical protein